MSIAELKELINDMPGDQDAEQFIGIAAEYGLCCFRIKQLNGQTYPTPKSLWELQDKLETELKSIIYA